jgi:hypothetical protein
MSHLLKKNKKILIILKLLFFCPLIALFFKALLLYEGNKVFYFIFTIISFYLLIFSFRKKSFFYENFLGVFLFLGFWFKFSIILSLNLGYGEGINGLNEKITLKNFDNALMVSVVGFLGFILFGHIREFYLNYPKKINIILLSNIYKRYRNLLIVIFVSLIIAITFSNIYFKIYQRGMIGENYNFLISGVIKTSLLYFLALISAVILFLDLAIYRRVFLFIIFLFLLESFLSSVSMLSRGMIFNSLALIFGIYKISNKMNINLEINFFIKILTVLFIFFFISVSMVNSLRTHYFSVKNISKNSSAIVNKGNNTSDEMQINNQKIKNEPKINIVYRSQILNLIIYRWVGIESLLIITKHIDKLSFNLFKRSLGESFDANSPSFYEKEFNLKPEFNQKTNKNLKGNTLPGFIAFLFFSGSYLFLFFSVAFFCLVATIFEFLTYKSFGKNLIASSLVAMTIAYRYIHFGYLPKQSYLLFGSIVGIITIVYIFCYIYKKINSINTNILN